MNPSLALMPFYLRLDGALVEGIRLLGFKHWDSLTPKQKRNIVSQITLSIKDFNTLLVFYSGRCAQVDIRLIQSSKDLETIMLGCLDKESTFVQHSACILRKEIVSIHEYIKDTN